MSLSSRSPLGVLSDSTANPAEPFRLLAESVPQLIWTALPDGRLDFTNQRWLDYTGLHADESRGWSWKEALHPDDRAECLDRWTTAIDRLTSYEIEVRLRGTDGGYRWFLKRAEPILDQEGRPVCWFGTFTDIHERKLRSDRTEERCRRIVEAAHDGIYEITCDGTIVFVNEAFAERLGYSVADMTGTSVFDYVFEADRSAAWEQLLPRNSEDRRRFDWRFRRRDQTELWTCASCAALTDAENEVVGAVGVFADITERRRREEQLRVSEERFRTSVDNLLDCFGIFESVRDADGAIVDFRFAYVNPAACANNRHALQEHLGKGLLELMPAHQTTGLFADYCRVVETGEPLSKQMCFYEDDFGGETLGRWFDIRASKLGDGFVAAWRDVTEAKRAEEALRAQERQFRLVLENTHDGFHQLDLETGRYVFMSPSQERLTGFSQHELADLSADEAARRLHPDDRKRVQEHLDAIIAGEQLDQPMEYRWRVKSGEYRWFSDSRKLVRDSDGKPTSLVGVSRDITGYVRAVAAAEESEQRLRLAVEGSPISLYETDLDLRYRWIINPAPGFSAEEIVGKRDDELLPAEPAAEVMAFKQSVIDSGVARRQQFEIQAGKLQGRFDLYAEPVKHDGRVTGLRVSGIDLTPLAEAERELRESEERFRTLADNIAQFAWMKDPSGHTFWYNQRWYDYTGANFEQMQGWGWKQVHHPDHVDRVTESLKKCLREGTVWEETFPLRGRDGTYRWFLTRGVPIRDANGVVTRWFGTNTDITEQRELENELQRTATELARANRRKDQFLANVSHEIRSPMTAILGYLDLLDVRSEEDQRHVQTIRRNGEFLLALINDILDLSKIEADQFEADPVRFCPRELVAEVAELMEIRAREKGIEFGAEFATLMPRELVSDALRIRQILVNLVGNAIKFTQQGGVTIIASFDASAQEFVVEVADTGIGIAESQIERLFKPFEQMDGSTVRRFGGTGLGLAICHRLARALGGRISVSSEIGVGSRFSLHLPVEGPIELESGAPVESGRKSADRPTEPPDPESLQLHVLIVDDRPDIRMLLQRLLEKLGCTVVTRENGEQAVATIDREPQSFDAVIMDMQMPGMDGLTAVGKMRDNGYARPVIALTANAMSSDRQVCLDAGYSDYLSKPIDQSLLRDKLRHCVATRRE